MTRPAYAHPLLEARRAGRHPALVTVIYGHDWQVAPGLTRLAVKPGAARGHDWTCVAGLPVDVIHRAAPADDAECMQLLGEIAREAAQVMLVVDGARYCADVMAFLERIYARPIAWPQWWSAETEQRNERNRRQWISEAAATLEQFAA